MFKYFLAGFISLIILQVNAQQSVNSVGGDLKNSSGQINYSIGQIIDYVDSTNNLAIYNSIQVPKEVLILKSELISPKELKVSLGPNPFSNYVSLNFTELFPNKSLEYMLIDIQGKQLKTGKILNNPFQIDLTDLGAATYFLIIQDELKTSNTYKIVKQ